MADSVNRVIRAMRDKSSSRDLCAAVCNEIVRSGACGYAAVVVRQPRSSELEILAEMRRGGAVISGLDMDKAAGCIGTAKQVSGRDSVYLPLEGAQGCFGAFHVEIWRDTIELEHLETIGFVVAMALTNLRLREEGNVDEKLNQAGRHVLGLSHGVKNILQAMAGASEVVEHSIAKKDLKKLNRGWKILKYNIGRIGKLVLDMLAYSQEKPLNLTRCHINDLVNDAVESLAIEHELKQVSVKVNTAEGIPECMLDADMIEDVVLNLVLNSIDAVKPDSGHIEIQTCYDCSGGMITLKVSDNGPGIREEEAEWIFEPFTSGKTKGGTGLGLAITQRSVKEHNGSIKIEQSSGGGAEFVVSLPTNLSG